MNIAEFIFLFITAAFQLFAGAAENLPPIDNSESDASSIETVIEEKLLTAQEAVDDMRIGWNLGNTFDVYNIHWLNNPTVSDFETGWSNPVTTKQLIDTVKAAGFNAIKINVTWAEHISVAPDFTIDPLWLDRIEEVANYILDNDMYAFINVHHDASRGCEVSWLTMTEKCYQQNSSKFAQVWRQIANRFENYDEKLLFISLGEPCISTSWDGTAESQDVLNRFNALFVDTVRSCGGYNKTRLLVLPTHGASPSEGAIGGMDLPDDERLIVAIHSYTPNEFCFSQDTMDWATSTSQWGSETDKKQLTDSFKALYDTFVSRGVPVIIGEFGACYKDNSYERAEWADYYVSEAKKYGITCFWWDDGGTGNEKMSLLDRQTLKWYDDNLVSAIINAAE